MSPRMMRPVRVVSAGRPVGLATTFGRLWQLISTVNTGGRSNAATAQRNGVLSVSRIH
jgi:hypothetical protein